MTNPTRYGVTVTIDKTHFLVWSPYATAIELALYEKWNDQQRDLFPMIRNTHGDWSVALEGNHSGWYYTYRVTHPDGNVYEIVDPWAIAAAPNSKKGLIVQLEHTNPFGWINHKRPTPIPPSDVILYELHVRDFTISPSAGSEHPGLYLGLSETGTRCALVQECEKQICPESSRVSTGLDHLVELGITHVHLMPISDFQTVDELNCDGYNWGYDPVLFNVPEGSYAESPFDSSRITELKTLIQALHENGIAVILDVVYNHTYFTHNSNFNRLAPGYFHRTNEHGEFCNGSGCGNEMATENPKVRQFIVDSLLFWVKEYQIDGFRFDLMGLYDLETIETIHTTLRQQNPHLLLYGEPWIGGHSCLPEERRISKGRQSAYGVSLFNDAYRDAVRGDNDGHGRGAIHGLCDLVALQHGIVGEIDYNTSTKGFAKEPWEAITYICAHDNLILRDKIKRVTPSFELDVLHRHYRLAFNMMFFAYGIPFIHEGTEFYRGKHHHSNTYNSGDEVNALNWVNKCKYNTIYLYIKSIIALRKSLRPWYAYNALQIRKNLRFSEVSETCIAYNIKNTKGHLYIHFNLSDEPQRVSLPPNRKVLVFDDVVESSVLNAIDSSVLELPRKSTLVYLVPPKEMKC